MPWKSCLGDPKSAMFGQSKALNRIAASITAEDICAPFTFEIDAQSTCRDAEERWNIFCLETNTDPFDHLVLVTKAGNHVGWVAYDSLGAHEEIIEDVMDHLTLSNLVSSDTSLLETAKLYQDKSPWIFIVLKANRPLGWISYHALLGPAFRACLFGLLLGIEQTMADILKTDPNLALTKIPTKRLEAANRVYELRAYQQWRGQHRSANELINCTTFIDKVTTIESFPQTLAALRSFNRTTFAKAEALRNALAHPTPENELIRLLPKSDLHTFITWLTTLEAELTAYLKSGDRIS